MNDNRCTYRLLYNRLLLNNTSCNISDTKPAQVCANRLWIEIGLGRHDIVTVWHDAGDIRCWRNGGRNAAIVAQQTKLQQIQDAIS